jgi:ubiquinone/menaquinone biosynthesis C-methylase UbiE
MAMSIFTDHKYLTTDQYRDSSNLEARLAIHPRFSTNPYGWFNWIFDSLSKLPTDATILELGCGGGHLWRNIADKIPAGWNIILSDLSQGMVDAAWRNLVVTGRVFKFEQINAESIPYQDGSFDAVIANHMLYHVPDCPKAIAEIKRVLRPNGRLFATTVGENHMKELDEWRRRANSKYAGSLSMPFNLENGMEQLTPFFSEVRLSRYEDSLHVTEIEPIIVYLCSVIGSSDLNTNELEKIRAELETRLEQEKMIFISKDSGLFKAVK